MGHGSIDLTVSTFPESKPLKKLQEIKAVLGHEISDEEHSEAGKINVNDVDFAGLTKNVTEVVQHLGTKIHFSYDERSTVPVIRVMDDETGELIRQIPREEMLQLFSKLKELAGLIFQGES